MTSEEFKEKLKYLIELRACKVTENLRKFGSKGIDFYSEEEVTLLEELKKALDDVDYLSVYYEMIREATLEREPFKYYTPITNQILRKLKEASTAHKD